MYKKLFLCLLLTTDLYPAEQGKNDKLSTATMAAVVVTAGALVFAMYASDEKKFEELTSKLSDGDVEKIFEVAGVWFSLTLVLEGLIYAPARCKEIYEDWFPTEEQKAAKEASIIAATASIKYYDARVKFRNCLMNCKPGCEKNSSGCPTVCEELAQNFIALGHQDEVDRMTKAFNGFGR